MIGGETRPYDAEIHAIRRKMRAIQKHRYFLKEYNKKMEEVIQREEGKDGMSMI